MIYTPNSQKATIFTSEASFQQYCVSWFAANYPQCRGFLFAIKNNSVNATQGMQDRAKGTLKGVSDLCLLLPNGRSIWIEMKLPEGRQSQDQHQWEQQVSKIGHKYVICRELNEFKEIIQFYYGKAERN